MTAIKLGDVARDEITGFQGVVICISKWLHGCERVTLQPQELKDGEPIKSATFDMPQLKHVTPKVVKGTADGGGPRPEPSQGRG